MDQVDDLARRAAGGDVAAFAELVRLHQGQVRRFLRRVAAADVADDLAQETFLKAWRQRNAWRAEGSYGGWLMRIAWTSFLGSHRSEARHRARSERSAVPDESSRGSQDLRLDVERALGTLDARERAVAELCFADGYSHSEAAGILGLPLGTLKTIVTRARSKLVEALEGNHG